MNCKNVEPLLSLYLGGDLEEEQSRSVATHLQSCAECALVADEFAQASQLLQAYQPPVFRDETYAGVREQVLNQIGRQCHTAGGPGIFSQLFLALVQPRMRWITAALLLAISVTALYFTRKPSRQMLDDQHVAVRTEITNESAGSSPIPNKAQVTKATTPRSITRKKKGNAGVVAINSARQSDKTQPSTASAPLRVELQTSNRNIRIIWLSRDERPGALGRNGSKVI